MDKININTQNSLDNKPKKKMSRLGLIFISMIVLLVLAIGTSVYFYIKSKPIDEAKEAQEDLKEVMELVQRHMLLPTDEEPTLATVSDPEKLTDQPFFKTAEKGDKVLLYIKSKKAILYSVSKDIILEVAPFSSSGAPGN